METKNRRKWCLLGIPDHEAVTHLGGRLGAASGPKAFQQAFQKMQPRFPIKDQLLDAGFVNLNGQDIAKNHAIAAHWVQTHHKMTELSVIVGGSHDHGHSHLLGLRNYLSEKKGPLARLGCINIDAHLDVREPKPQITSGSPFYLSLEAQVIQPEDFIEFGIQDHCNSRELWQYVEKKKVKVVSMRELRFGAALPKFESCLMDLASRCDMIAISLDLDAVASAYAPGVSAPAAEGLTPSEVFGILELAAKEPKVESLGIFELNPEHDFEDQTAKLAAQSAYYFISTVLQERDN
jgi:formiminoglutamase